MKTFDGKTTWTKEDIERFLDPPAHREGRPTNEPPPYDEPHPDSLEGRLARIEALLGREPIRDTPGQSKEPQCPAPPLDHYLDEYLKGKVGKAQNTQTKLRVHVKVLRRYLDTTRPVDTYKPQDIRVTLAKVQAPDTSEESRARNGRKPQSVNRIVIEPLRAAFELALEDGVIERTPMDRVQYLDAKPVVRHDWTWDQAWALVKEAGRFSPEAGLLGECMLAFGIGPGEVQGLRGEHFDFDRKCLRAKRQKTGEPYDIPFWPWAQPLLDKIKPRLTVGRPVFEWRSLRHVYRRACERLGLPSYELRTFRRCYIVHLRELNIHDAVIANFQGHADSALIQKTYGKNMSAEFVAREIAKAFTDRVSTP